MITVKIHGGLGNQMFEYAFARALSLKNHDSLRVDPSSLYDITPREPDRYRKKYDKTWRKDVKYRSYGLADVFAINPAFNWVARIESVVKIPYVATIVNKYYPRVFGKLGVWKYIKEKGMRFDPAYFNLKGNVYLEGYFRSEKYFKDYADTIRKDFTFRHPLEDDSARLGKEIAESNSVCLHVRRGDNVWNPASQKTHLVIPMSYYEKAVAIIKERAGKDIGIYVFSDDIEWCRTNMKFDAPLTFVGDEHKGIQDGGHLQLMSLCKHFIIPESTFSWWAAWLAPSNLPRAESRGVEGLGKIVIAPDEMFKDKTIETQDMIPEGWMRI
ncbi:MAG: alpha-1,2-fucosyltransferase [Patescibacteria group bacterium]|nr:alpha-1,2-fucosyltransferase [Patescibacteria group bacterium]